MAAKVEMEPKNEFPPELQSHYSLIIPSNEIAHAQQKMAAEINRDYTGKRPILLTVLNGARRTTDEMKKFLTIEYDEDTIWPSSYSGSETTGQITLVEDMKLDPKGRLVLISEDVLDTGLTLNYLLELLKSREAEDIDIAVLTTKIQERLLVRGIHPRYIGIGGINGYIVGHGFDDGGNFREYDHIYLKNDPAFDPSPFLRAA